MIEKLKKMPYPGLRNIKTALAGTFCIVLYLLLGRVEGLALACIAAFICVQDSVDKSWGMARDRVFGTLLGGAFAIAAGQIYALEQHLVVVVAVAFVGVVLYIFVCNLLKIEGSILIGLSAYVVILFGAGSTDLAPLPIAINRTLDTLVGIVVGCGVNILLFRPRPERFRGQEAVNPAFHYELRRSGHHKTVRWDGGETEELYIYPEDRIYQRHPFDFRVAVNHSEAMLSHFRNFPGMTRHLMLLAGEVRLVHKGQHSITLGPYEQDLSRSDWETECRGRGTDISLLTAEGFTGKLELLYEGDKQELINNRFVSFYGLTDGAKLLLKNGAETYKEELAKGDYVIVSWFENGEAEYSVEVCCEAGESEGPLVLLVTAGIV